MKRINVFMVTVFAFSLISMISPVSPEVYGAESLKKPSGTGGNPAAVLLIDQGIHFFTNRQLEAALSSFDMAIQMDPILSEAYFNAGITALELGMREKGFSYLEQFAKQRPEEWKAFLSIGGSGITTAGLPAVAGSGFWEFGLSAIIGSIFVFIAGAYLVSSSSLPGILSQQSALFVMGFASGRVFPEKTKYMVYPLLKLARPGMPTSLFAIMERRGNKNLPLSESIA